MSSDIAVEHAGESFRRADPAGAEALLRAALPDPSAAAVLRDYLLTEGRTGEALEVAAMRTDALDAAVEDHLAGRFERAAEHSRGILEREPDNIRAALHFARAAFNLGRQQPAFRALDHALATVPDFAEGWYALAHAQRAVGRLEDACTSYRRALDARPGTRAARLNLGITCLALDDATGALEQFDALLELDAGDVEARVNAGLACHLAGETGKAEHHLRRALERDPDHPDAHRYLGALYNEAGDADAAVRHLEKALAQAPDDPDLHADLADVHELSSRLDAAAEWVDRGLHAAPGHPRLVTAAARLDRRRGETDAALQKLQRVDPRSLPPRLAQPFFHELGLALDRARRADEAVQAFATANRISGHNPRARAVDRDAFGRRLDALAAWLDAPPGEAIEVPGDTGGDLCFLVGFPRSGTTLLDTMLDAHPDVAGIEEKPTLERVIARLSARPGGYPVAMDRLTTDDIRALRALYREAAGQWLDDENAGLIIDKLPLRLLETGLIRRLFPEARVLFLRRHPCDVVLSNFIQLFEPNEAFIHTGTLEGTVGFYDRVMGLWSRLAAQVGDRLAYVRYEDLVADAEGELERLCEFLDIEPHPDMLDSEKRAAGRGRIRTNSYQQVAEAVYSRSAGRWTRYRKHLEPHLETLRPHAEGMGYSVDIDT